MPFVFIYYHICVLSSSAKTWTEEEEFELADLYETHKNSDGRFRRQITVDKMCLSRH